MPLEPHDTAIGAIAEQGVVLLDGPNGIATSLTPQAARQSARNLTQAADLAERAPPEPS